MRTKICAHGVQWAHSKGQIGHSMFIRGPYKNTLQGTARKFDFCRRSTCLFFVSNFVCLFCNKKERSKQFFFTICMY